LGELQRQFPEAPVGVTFRGNTDLRRPSAAPFRFRELDSAGADSFASTPQAWANPAHATGAGQFPLGIPAADTHLVVRTLPGGASLTDEATSRRLSRRDIRQVSPVTACAFSQARAQGHDG
jgi:hypothetical protein